MLDSASLEREFEELPQLIGTLIEAGRLEDLRWLVIAFADPDFCGTTFARASLSQSSDFARRSGFPGVAALVDTILAEED